MTSVKPEEYLALNKYSNGLIGNSSSGLIEAPSLTIATINIGDRQKGRVRGETVIDCICKEKEIIDSITNSQTEDMRKKVMNSVNPYYQKAVLDNIVLDIKYFFNHPIELCKDFYDIKISN